MPATITSSDDDIESTCTRYAKDLDYAHRMRNFRLEKLGLVELRAKMEFFGLDVTGLRFKWQYIDRLERHRRKHGIPQFSNTLTGKPRRGNGACFTSLPAELRNAIYEAVLICPKPILLHYSPASSPQIRPDPPNSGRKQLRNFAALSLANAQISAEVRSFFFARNHFQFCAMPPYSLSAKPHFHIPAHFPDYLNAYTQLLERMGAEGRMTARWLVLSDERERTETWTCDPGYHHFFKLLQTCRNLTTLAISITPDHLTHDDPSSYHQYLLGRCTLPRKALRNFAARFSALHFPHLNSLTFVYTVSDREYMAFDAVAVERHPRVPFRRARRHIGRWGWDRGHEVRHIEFMKELVAQRIEVLMASMKGMVEKVTEARVRIIRMPLATYRCSSFHVGNHIRTWHVREYGARITASEWSPRIIKWAEVARLGFVPVFSTRSVDAFSELEI